MIGRAEESYRLCVPMCECELETSTVRRPRPELDRGATHTQKKYGLKW